MTCTNTATNKKDEALTAFTSAFLHDRRRNATTASALSSEQWAQKVATILKPGPPFYSRVDNSDLIKTLGDSSLMNCVELQVQALATKKTDTAWTGVGTIWSALDSLPAGASWGQIPGAPSATVSDEKDEEDDGLWSSILLSVDTNGGDVALEKSVAIPTHVLSSNNFFRGNRAVLKEIGVGETYHWDNFSNYKEDVNSVVSSKTYLLGLPTHPIADFWNWPSWIPFLGSSSGRDSKSSDENDDKDAGSPKKDQKGVKRVWIPSTTKASFLAQWWGFTLYLPQAVMAEVGKDAEKAENIAMTISKMLTALLDGAAKIPLPASFQAVLTVLKSIAPVTQYISTYIGWSWNELKTLDKGEGICLSTTWVLPVALIPRTWDAPSAPPAKDRDGRPDGALIPANPSDDNALSKGDDGKAEARKAGEKELPQTERGAKDQMHSAETHVKPTGNAVTKPMDRSVNQPEEKEAHSPKNLQQQGPVKQAAGGSTAENFDKKFTGGHLSDGNAIQAPAALEPRKNSLARFEGQKATFEVQVAAGNLVDKKLPKDMPSDGQMPDNNVAPQAPVERVSQPAQAVAPTAALDPSKRAEHPRNGSTTQNPALGATMPPANPKLISGKKGDIHLALRTNGESLGRSKHSQL